MYALLAGRMRVVRGQRPKALAPCSLHPSRSHAHARARGGVATEWVEEVIAVDRSRRRSLADSAPSLPERSAETRRRCTSGRGRTFLFFDFFSFLSSSLAIFRSVALFYGAAAVGVARKGRRVDR